MEVKARTGWHDDLGADMNRVDAAAMIMWAHGWSRAEIAKTLYMAGLAMDDPLDFTRECLRKSGDSEPEDTA